MSGGAGTALAWCPFPDAASAERAADILLGEGLIACANILPGMQSRSIWRGERTAGIETGVLFKTSCVLLEKLVARIAALHPYDEPAILGWGCDAAAPGTVRWLGELVAPPGIAGGDATGEAP
jgi:periplasmic divalent cation tolerance protein